MSDYLIARYEDGNKCSVPSYKWSIFTTKVFNCAQLYHQLSNNFLTFERVLSYWKITILKVKIKQFFKMKHHSCCTEGAIFKSYFTWSVLPEDNKNMWSTSWNWAVPSSGKIELATHLLEAKLAEFFGCLLGIKLMKF